MSLTRTRMFALVRKGLGGIDSDDLTDPECDELLNLALWELEDKYEFDYDDLVNEYVKATVGNFDRYLEADEEEQENFTPCHGHCLPKQYNVDGAELDYACTGTELYHAISVEAQQSLQMSAREMFGMVLKDYCRTLSKKSRFREFNAIPACVSSYDDTEPNYSVRCF